MATTKKVGRRNSLEKKAAPKKSVVSSRAQRKLPKTPPQTKKKTKVSATKLKQAPKKKDLPKTVEKKTTSSKKIKASSASNLRKAPKTKKEGSAFSTKTQVPLGILALYIAKFPVNLDIFAMQTARFGGVAIVVMGGFFTMHYAQEIWNAPLALYTTSSQQVATVAHTGVDTVTQTTEPLFVVMPEPAATISIDAPEPLQKEVPLFVFVEDAHAVDILVFHESYADSIHLGKATKVAQGKWKYLLDTEFLSDEFGDGKYKIVADITNAYHDSDDPYRQGHDTYLTVDNSVQQHVVSTTTSEQVLPAEKPQVVLVMNAQSPVIGDVYFKITVSDAQKVVLSAKHIKSDSVNRLGEAVQIEGDIWKYIWDTTEYVQGDYVISTAVTNTQGSYSDGVLALSILSEKEEPQTDLPKIDDSEQEEVDTTEESIVGFDEVKDMLPVLELSTEKNFRKTEKIEIYAPEATFVELHLQRKGSQNSQFLGLAKKKTDSQWIFTWDTQRLTPNGVYSLYARAGQKIGWRDSIAHEVVVENEPFVPEQNAEQVEKIAELKKTEKITQELLPEETSIDVAQESLDEKQEADLLVDFDQEIFSELERFTAVARTDDPEAIAYAEERLTRLKKDIVAKFADGSESNELTAKINKEIEATISQRRELIKEVEDLISTRVNEDVFTDSDSDGISDYDEYVLYKTDPFSADSDNDGFIDGLEIERGFDPLDSRKEAAIIHESPKENGIVREDILVVQSIVPVEVPVDKDTDGVLAQAVISGIGLPNSFVTLYIYSTPTVVTVKTEQDGSWKYRFDKELEDGAHEVYVGVTDNTGKLIAKSAAFAFVKEAQAFTPADATGPLPVVGATQDESLLSQFMIYLILSISVVSIGLVLILLGLHLDSTRHREALVTKDDSKA